MEILQQAARGLDAAHKLGIIHRDLKPDNIFLTCGDEGELIVKVVDFGMAKLRESLNPLMSGRAPYMSYEQACGMRSDQLDARCDVYSLGIVLYEMLTGRVPSHAGTLQGYLRKHMMDDPSPFRAVASGLPVSPEVELVVMKALARDREQRYASVLDLARDFARAASEELPPTVVVETLDEAQAEQERQAREKAEAERREKERAEAERRSALPSDPELPPAPQR